jgi:hypothetical protein
MEQTLEQKMEKFLHLMSGLVAEIREGQNVMRKKLGNIEAYLMTSESAGKPPGQEAEGNEDCAKN